MGRNSAPSFLCSIHHLSLCLHGWWPDALNTCWSQADTKVWASVPKYRWCRSRTSGILVKLKFMFVSSHQVKWTGVRLVKAEKCMQGCPKPCPRNVWISPGFSGQKSQQGKKKSKLFLGWIPVLFKHFYMTFSKQYLVDYGFHQGHFAVFLQIDSNLLAIFRTRLFPFWLNVSISLASSLAAFPR